MVILHNAMDGIYLMMNSVSVFFQFPMGSNISPFVWFSSIHYVQSHDVRTPHIAQHHQRHTEPFSLVRSLFQIVIEIVLFIILFMFIFFVVEFNYGIEIGACCANKQQAKESVYYINSSG